MTPADGSVVHATIACRVGRLDVRELRRRVAGARVDRFGVDDFEAEALAGVVEVRQPRLAVVVVAVDHRHLRLLLLAHVLLHDLRDVEVGDRHLEDPLPVARPAGSPASSTRARSSAPWRPSPSGIIASDVCVSDEPMIATTCWSSSLRVLLTAVVALDSSSRIVACSGRPLTPPALLISSTAIWMLSASGRPSVAPGPLSETVAPMRIGSPAAATERGGAVETIRSDASASAPSRRDRGTHGDDLLQTSCG